MEVATPGTPLILDVGSAYVKVGFAGEQKPSFVFPCLTGTEKYQAVMADVSTRSIYVGDDAMRMRGVLKIKHPIQRGVIKDWNDYYEILNHIIYNILRLENLSFHPVLYIEAPFVQKETKEYIARVLFETHKADSLMMVPSPLLASFSTGLTTSLVVESGDGGTWVVPVINGQIYNAAVQRLNLGGWDINQNLMALMMRHGIMLSSSASEEILREIKEKNCYFVLDPRNPPSAQESLKYTMPDGSVVEIPAEFLYQSPEVMFNPAMLGYNMMNIPQAIIYCLQMIDSSYWAELLSHIVLSGGNASYSGFEERLKHELTALLPQLGQIPKKAPVIAPKKKLLSLDITPTKTEDTCSKCGTLVDLSKNNNCPSCGASMSAPVISLDLGMGLGGKKKEKTSKKVMCPHCLKVVKDVGSSFCPYCGQNIEAFESLDKVAEKIEEELSFTTDEFAGFHDPTQEIIKFFVSRHPEFSNFNGAAILASLPSVKPYFITNAEFQTDPNLLYRDISQILSQ